MARTIVERAVGDRAGDHAAPRRGEPYDNYRPFNISAKYDGQTLLDTLRGIFPACLRAEHWDERLPGGGFSVGWPRRAGNG